MPTTAFALATPAVRRGQLDFLRRGAFLGNLMRTPDPFSAWTFPNATEAGLFLESLPDGVKEQLADRPLLIVPLTLTVGEAAETIALTTVAPAKGDQRARRKAEKGTPLLTGGTR